MKKKPTQRTRSNKKKTKTVLNWLSPKHPFHKFATDMPSGLYEQIKDEVLTIQRMSGGSAKKRIKGLLLLSKEACNKAKNKSRWGVWKYLEKNLPHSKDCVEEPGAYYYRDPTGGGHDELVWIDESGKEKSISYTTFRLYYFPKKDDQ